jgi:hypothetical protein
VSDERFACVQVDLPGHFGIDDGRYLLRGGDGREEAVLVVQTLGSPVHPPRRRRPRRVEPMGEPPEVPLTRITVIDPRPSSSRDAAGELERTAGDPDAAEARVAKGLKTANALLRARRVAAADPYGRDASREGALAARLGYGSGEELAAGSLEDAVLVPQPDRPRRRAEALRPQERMAAILGGRQSVEACETLLLRARADLDQGFPREAALQLRIGLDALLAELPGRAGPEQENDLAALSARRETVHRAADEAARGPLSADRMSEVAETLGVCERVLRRRQILSG